MFKQIARFAAAVFGLVVLLAACGGDESPTELTVVTHDSFAVTEEVIADFEAESGYEVTFLTSSDVGTMVTEAVLTKDNPVADVMFGIDNTFLSRGLDEGIFEPYEAAGLDSIDDQFKLDPELRVTPIDYGDVCVNFTKDLDGAAELGLDDLSSAEFAGTWVTQNPETSSPGMAMLLATVATYGEDGWEDFWSEASANGLTVTSGWTDAYFGDFVAGGGDKEIVTSYASSPVAEVAFAEEPIDEPSTGVVTDTCFRQIEFAGVLANASNPEGAQAFVDFMLTDTFQNDVPLNMFVYPVSDTATLPEIFLAHTTPVPDPLTLDPVLIGENREAWTARWVEIVLQ